jgi:F-type H+-transporting ATPase subunit a
MSAIPEGIAYNFGVIPVSMVMSWIVWLLIIVPSCAVRFAFKHAPGKLQTLFEICFEWIFSLADEFIGDQAPHYYPLFCGLFLYVLVCNLIGLIPGFVSPTADLSVTASLAVMVFLYYNFIGFRKHGLKYIAHFFGPSMPWYMAPVRVLLFVIEVIGNFAKPFSLAMRLFCNILSKEILLAILAYLIVYFISGNDITQKALLVAPLLLRPFIVILGFMLAFVQALIFMVLTITYIAGAVGQEEQEEQSGGKETC